jgi:hypothetical protein
MIYGVRPAGARRIQWIESDEPLTPGSHIVVDNDVATIVVAEPQLHESSSNVEPEAMSLHLAELVVSAERHASDIELDRMLSRIPAIASHWNAAGARGIVELVDLKRGTFVVRGSEGSDANVLAIDFMSETGED